MNSKLLFKISQGEKGVGGIETFLVLAVAAFHFAIMSGRVGTDEFVTDAQISSRFLEKWAGIPLAVRKTVSELKTVVGLDTFHPDPPSCIPLH